MAVDLSRFQRSILDQSVRQARELEQRQAPEAAAAWESAARHADQFADSALSDSERRRRSATARQFRMKAESLRRKPEPAARVTDTHNHSADEFRANARRLIHRSNVQFSSIAGLHQTIREIRSAFALSMAIAPEGVQIPKMRNLLFYGPAGCGKTLLAAAISNGLDATFFSVKVSDVLSRYYGDSPRLVQALYEEARQCGHSVIFLDEFDAVAASRSDSDSSADRRLLVSLLTELDGLREKDSGHQVITIAATNRPWELDEAILSRFEKSIYIPLPDWSARQQILRHHLQGNGYTVQIDAAVLEQATEGLSGRDISHLCQLMIEHMMSEANPTLETVVDGGRTAMQSYRVQVKPLTNAHLNAVRPLVINRTTAESLELFHRWSAEGGVF